MTTTSPAPAKANGLRTGVQRFGTFLSGMIMPNIAAFIAWGFITMLFIPAGFFGAKSPFGWHWAPVAEIIGGGGDSAVIGWQGAMTAVAEGADGNIFAYVGLVGPMVTYLLPLLIANTAGRMVYGERGGVVATIATMGVIVGTNIPMFLGAMIMGPIAAWITKQMDKLWDGKIRPGFEMLVNNFSAGILGMILAIVGFFAFGPVMLGISAVLGAAVDWLVSLNLLPLVSIIVEPAKVLFLNNAINHGVFTPLGIEQAAETGKSILFLIEANPAPASVCCSPSPSSVSARRRPRLRARPSSSSSVVSTRSTSRTRSASRPPSSPSSRVARPVSRRTCSSAAVSASRPHREASSPSPPERSARASATSSSSTCRCSSPRP